jgi:pyruvate formate lyase activating enzyme
MVDVPATPIETLLRARDIGLKQGLQHVYTGNVHHAAGDTTFCSSCREPLIVRDWYELTQYRLTPDGRCPNCGGPVPGRFAASPGHFGRRRIPVVIAAN